MTATRARSARLDGPPLEEVAPSAAPPAAAVTTLAPLSLRANVGWTLFGNAIYAGCQWGMLVALAKVGSPEVVGAFSLALAVSAPVVMFSNLQLAQIQATDTRRSHGFREYLGLRVVMSALAMAAIIIIAYSGERTAGAALVIALVGFTKIVESVSDICYGLFQQRERMDLCTRSVLLRGPLSLAGLALGLVVTGSLAAGVMAMAASWLVVLVACDLPAARRIQREAASGAETRRDALASVKQLFLLSFPMGVVTLLWTLNLTVPRYFIESYLGERELGFFSAMAYAVISGTIVVHALGRSASPTLARHYAAGNARAFARLLARMVLCGAALGAAGVGAVAVAGPLLLRVLYRPEYAAHSDTFLAIMVAGGLGYVAEILVYGLTSARLFKAQLPLFALALAVTAIGCYARIPGHGLLGAVQASAAAFVVCSVGAVAILSRALRALGANDR